MQNFLQKCLLLQCDFISFHLIHLLPSKGTSKCKNQASSCALLLLAVKLEQEVHTNELRTLFNLWNWAMLYMQDICACARASHWAPWTCNKETWVEIKSGRIQLVHKEEMEGGMKIKLGGTQPFCKEEMDKEGKFEKVIVTWLREFDVHMERKWKGKG